MPSTAGHIIAPPIPISARQTISQSSSCAAPAEQREAGEDRGPDEEDAPPAEHVREPAAGHDQHAEDERVGVDHPLHGRDVRVEVLLDLGQRDAQRGDVVGHDEDRDRHRPESDPGFASHGAATLHQGCSVCRAPAKGGLSGVGRVAAALPWPSFSLRVGSAKSTWTESTPQWAARTRWPARQGAPARFRLPPRRRSRRAGSARRWGR